MIAVTFALPAESSEFLRRLDNKLCTGRDAIRIIRGTLDDREVEVLHTGVGEKVCRQRVGKFLQDQQFEFLISAGFAGALNDELHSGDLLLARNFSTLDLTERRSFPSLPIHQADLLTMAALIDSSEERNEIARSTDATAVDMETEFIARACAEHSIPLLSLRVITDTPREPFPAPPKILFSIERQRTHLLKLARFLLAHPNKIPRLIEFARRIARARKILGTALVEIIKKL
jgi:adenosylhomocysteine nucleosidase